MTVYFVQDGGPEGHIKIGYTGTAAGPFGRIGQLQTGNPRPLMLLVCIPNGTAADEKALHERFKDLRGSGEWFRPDARLLGFVEGLKVAFPEQPKDPGPEATFCDLTLNQLRTIAGFVRGQQLEQRVRRFTDEALLADRGSSILDEFDALECVELVELLQAEADYQEPPSTWEAVGARVATGPSKLKTWLDAISFALDQHHSALGARIAEERLAVDGLTGAVELLEEHSNLPEKEEDYPF